MTGKWPETQDEMFSWSDCVSRLSAGYMLFNDLPVKITANDSILLNK